MKISLLICVREGKKKTNNFYFKNNRFTVNQLRRLVSFMYACKLLAKFLKRTFSEKTFFLIFFSKVLIWNRRLKLIEYYYDTIRDIYLFNDFNFKEQLNFF